jgi:nicotinate-nucleotide adenylyltransferase
MVLAQEAASELGLERVLLVPEGEAPHKRIDPEPGPEVRLALVRAAAAGDELLEVSEIEIARPGPSYTFRTLELLRDERPDDEFTFLLGADAAAQLEDWREPRQVLELARLAIAGRPGTARAKAEGALQRLGSAQRADFISMPEIGISSTIVRRRVAEGRPLRYLVLDAVAELIRERGLYREAVRA